MDVSDEEWDGGRRIYGKNFARQQLDDSDEDEFIPPRPPPPPRATAVEVALPPPDGSKLKPLPDPGVGERTFKMWYTGIKKRGYEDGLPRKWKSCGSKGVWSCPCGTQKSRCELHKGDRIRFEAHDAAKVSVPVPRHTLAFADFEAEAMGILGEHIFTYRGSPLWGRGTKVRGTIAERVVRRFDELVLGNETIEPERGVDLNGNPRGEGQEIHEYRRKLDGGRLESVEVKNARAYWDTTGMGWVVLWANIKKDLHDVLILSLETPTGYALYERGTGTLGDGGNGVAEEVDGKDVKVTAKRGDNATTDVHAAIEEMHAKLVARGDTFLGEVALDDQDYTDSLAYRTVTEDVFEGTPLAELSNKARGDVCEELARLVGCRVLAWIVSDAKVTDCVHGGKRGRNATKADFNIDGAATEVKSSQMCWRKNHNCFWLQFVNVKTDDHQRRILAMVTPRGVHLFEHTGSTAGLSRAGAREAAHGKVISAVAPVGMRDPAAAEEFLLKQFVHHWELPYLAFVAARAADSGDLRAKSYDFSKWLSVNFDEVLSCDEECDEEYE